MLAGCLMGTFRSIHPAAMARPLRASGRRRRRCSPSASATSSDHLRGAANPRHPPGPWTEQRLGSRATTSRGRHCHRDRHSPSWRCPRLPPPLSGLLATGYTGSHAPRRRRAGGRDRSRGHHRRALLAVLSEACTSPPVAPTTCLPAASGTSSVPSSRLHRPIHVAHPRPSRIDHRAPPGEPSDHPRRRDAPFTSRVR
jgi:hypothetical protein